MNKSTEVEEFLKSLDYSLKVEVVELRIIILSANKEITEHIKWNAPSFCVNNQDRVTMNLRSDKFVDIIFHRGAKINNSEFKFEDTTGLLTWLSPDRASIKFSNMDEVKVQKENLVSLVNKWIELTA